MKALRVEWRVPGEREVDGMTFDVIAGADGKAQVLILKGGGSSRQLIEALGHFPEYVGAYVCRVPETCEIMIGTVET